MELYVVGVGKHKRVPLQQIACRYHRVRQVLKGIAIPDKQLECIYELAPEQDDLVVYLPQSVCQDGVHG